MFKIIIFSISFILTAALSYYLGSINFFKNIKKKEAAEPLLDDDQAQNPDVLFKALLEYFAREKPYHNPNLGVKDIAKDLLTNRTYISKAIRKNGMKNFNYFVNTYRIREAIDIFRMDPMARVGETAIKCGFNTTAAFTMAFKICLNMTPKQWKDYYITSVSVPVPPTGRSMPRKRSRKSTSGKGRK